MKFCFVKPPESDTSATFHQLRGRREFGSHHTKRSLVREGAIAAASFIPPQRVYTRRSRALKINFLSDGPGVLRSSYAARVQARRAGAQANREAVRYACGR
jgi:hypothetical protein